MRIYETMISINSDYIMLRNDESLMLFLGERLMWSKDSFGADTRLLGLGNNGALLLVEYGKIVFYHQDGFYEEILEPEPYSHFNKAVLDGQGRRFCAEVEVQRDQSQKKRLGLFFRTQEVEDQMRLHRIFICDSVSREKTEIWDFERDVQNDGSIMWDITRELDLFAVAETSWIEKPIRTKLTRLYMINLCKDKSLFQINFTNIDLKGIHINEKGMLLIDILDEGHQQYILINTKGEKTYINPPLRNMKLLHFGNDAVVFKTLPEKVILFKDFRDNLIYIFDERMLESIGYDIPIIFKSNDDVLIMCYDEEKSTLTRRLYSWKGNKIDFLYHK